MLLVGVLKVALALGAGDSPRLGVMSSGRMLVPKKYCQRRARGRNVLQTQEEVAHAQGQVRTPQARTRQKTSSSPRAEDHVPLENFAGPPGGLMALPRFQEDDEIRERAINAIAESTFNRQVSDNLLLCCRSRSAVLLCSRVSMLVREEARYDQKAADLVRCGR